MALINCPECGKEISDKAVNCIHCGYPIQKESIIDDPNIYIYHGVSYNISEVKMLRSQGQIVRAVKAFRELTNADLKTAKDIVDNLSTSKTTIIRCPKCGSTDFELIKRNWSIVTGFMTNKIDRVCRSCKTRF